MHKIAVVTGTRAEYGLLYWILRDISEDSQLELQLIVTGTHLSPEFGMTVKDIERDGFSIADRVEMLLSADTEAAISTSMGLGMIGFSGAYSRLEPDLLLVLGDRFEILSAVAAAVPFRIPVAHIHGGESTEGAMDELFRHAITKMSYLHFPTTETYADRVVQMGEESDRVFCFGAPGVDNVYKLALLDKKEIAQELELPPDRSWGIVTYHPVTLKKNAADDQICELLRTLSGFPEIYWVFTLPNADAGSRAIMGRIQEYVQSNRDNVRLFDSLGQVRYLSLLKHSVLMVGNSSSGIMEAPSFRLPVVNIGDRQKGRIRAANVIDTPKCDRREIESAIRKAMSDEFTESLRFLENPYGKGDASARIVKVLKDMQPYEGPMKMFYDFRVAGQDNYDEED